MTDDELRQACEQDRDYHGRFMIGPLSLHERFMLNVQITDTCWIWTGSVARGYGRFWMNGNHVRAHRASYALHNNCQPGNIYVCHSCDVKLCVRPDHLFLGKAKENYDDAVSKGLYPFGAKRISAKLNDDKVREIRLMKARGISLSEIGRAFRVNPGTIANVINGRSWWHVV